MADSRIDLDKRQTLRDVYRPNRYALDTRFVLRDGGTHPFAVICPGGAYQVVCSYIEGTPIARRLNELGISAFRMNGQMFRSTLAAIMAVNSRPLSSNSRGSISS